MRVIDLLEFNSTTPEEDEKRLSAFPGQQPPPDIQEPVSEPAITTEPIQQPQPGAVATPDPTAQPQPVPTAQPQPVPTAPVAQPVPVAQPQPDERSSILATVVSSKLKKLVADANSIPDWEPAKRLVLDLIRTLTSDNILKESKSLDISPEEIAIAMKNIKFLETHGLMKLDETVDLASLAVKMVKNAKKEFKVLEKKYVLKAEEITNSIFDKLESLANKVQGYTSIDEGTYKSLTKAEKKVHDNAKNFAAVFKQAFFGMIMRMLRQNKELDRERIVVFLDACYNGQVIDMESLISQDAGNVKQHVNSDFEDMLDLFSSYGVFSWSPGKSSGAIGPGEMALSMMGSPAQKALHGGDLIVAGTNLEIKAGSTSGGRLNSKKILKGPAAWPTWTEKITKIVRTAPARKLKTGTPLGTTTGKTGEVTEMTKENYTSNTYNKNPKGHFKQGSVYNWSYKMLEKLNDEILIYSDYAKTYDLFYSTISKLITNLDEVSEPMMVNAGKGKELPKLTADGKIAFPGVDAEELIGNAVMEDGTIIVPAMMEAYTKLAYASYNRADGVEAIMFLNTDTLDYTIVQNGDDLANKMMGKGESTVRISGGFHFNDDQQSATPAYLATARSPKIEKVR
jgi:hypothetical protein